MAPKKQISWESGTIKKTPCSQKNTTRLSIARVASVQLLRAALQNTQTPDGISYYSFFKDLDWANECVFSYSNSDWVGIYLKDQSGNNYWVKNNEGEIKYEKLYFQINIDSNGEPEIVNFSNKLPPELENVQQCVVENGKCREYLPTKNKVVPTVPTVPTTVPTVPMVPMVPKVVKQVKENKKITREEFEQMGSKEVIINWMLENMDPVDILSCLQGSNLSGDDIKSSNNIVSIASTSGSSNVNNLVKEMDDLDISTIIKEVSFQDLIDQINEISNLENKYSRIIEICSSSGVIEEDNFGIRKSKKYGIQLTVDDQVQTEDDISKLIDKCAREEAKRLTNNLKKGKAPLN